MTPPRAEEGFTLIEVIVVLALFGLIALAGFTLVNSILSVQAGTRGRLDRLAALQRAVTLVDADVTQVAPGAVSGGGDVIAFDRRAGNSVLGEEPIRYSLGGGVLTRSVGGRGQRLLEGVQALRWRFLVPGAGWVERWPPDPRLKDSWPQAVEMEMNLAPGQRSLSGRLRHTMLLPAQP